MEDESVEESEESVPEVVPIAPEPKETPQLKALETKKEIRKVLNKVSEGNIDPMF